VVKSRLEVEHAFAAFSNYFLLFAAVIFGSSVDVAKSSIIVFSHLALKGVVRLIISNHILQDGSQRGLRFEAGGLCGILSLALCVTLFSTPTLRLRPDFMTALYFSMAIFLSFYGEALRLIRISQNLIAQSLRIQFVQFLFLVSGIVIILLTQTQREKLTFFVFLSGFALSGLAYIFSDNPISEINSTKIDQVSLWSTNMMISLTLSVLSYVPLLIINFLFFSHLASETIDLYQSSSMWFIPLSFLTNVAYIQAITSSQGETKNRDSIKRFFKWACFLFTLASVYGFTLDKGAYFYLATFFVALSWVLSFMRQSINIRLVRDFRLSNILLIQVVYVFISIGFAVMFRSTSNLLSIHLSFFAAEFIVLILTKIVSERVLGKNK